MRENEVFTLQNGKKLGYAKYGADEGTPLFHFHGTGSSRLEGKLFHTKGLEKNIRIITIDRPGFGLSDFQNRKLLEWPDTVLELAQFLEIKKFSIMGISGGGPHCIVCAYKIPERLRNCIAIGTPGPPEIETKHFPWLLRVQGWIFKHFPFTYRQYMKMISKTSSDPEQLRNFTRKHKKRYPPADAKFILEDSGENLQLITRAIREGTQHTFKGAVHEMKLFSSSWGFQLQDISPNQKIILWHGEDDLTFNAAKEMNEIIPNCEARFFPNEGHFSVYMNYLEELFQQLLT
ncbi:MAG: alpha/beta fold hydrolase [Promethearchaeota archaeon]